MQLVIIHLFVILVVKNCECQAEKLVIIQNELMFIFSLKNAFLNSLKILYRITTFHYIFEWHQFSRFSFQWNPCIFYNRNKSHKNKFFFALFLLLIQSTNWKFQNVYRLKIIAKFRATVICFWIKMAAI